MFLWGYNVLRLKYFRLVLSVEDESEDLEDKWTPVIDMKSFREACFHGNDNKKKFFFLAIATNTI